MFELFIDCLLDAAIDSAKLLPFLAVIYILMEILSRKAGNNIAMAVKRANKLGPVIGGAAGVIPQCGFSAAAATLYSGKVISVGTMLAVFLSASDDMLPILISSAFPPDRILIILAAKMIIAIVTGYLVDISLYLFTKKRQQKKVLIMGRKKAATKSNEPICMQSCCTGPFFIAVLKKTFQVFAYIFLVSLLLNIVIETIGTDTLEGFLNDMPIAGEFLSAIIGLIPNCASSVIITELYLDNVLTTGALFAGLLVNAGVGTLILIRSNKNKKENFLIITSLYFIGVAWGILIELCNISFNLR